MIHSLWDLFFVPVGLEPQVRVRGARGRCRWQMERPERVAAVGVQRSRSDGKAHTASPQQDTRHHNTYPYLMQSYQQG